MLLKERFSVLAAQRVLGSGVLEPAERKRLLAYLAAGMRGANADGQPSSEGVVEVEYVRQKDLLGRFAERAVPTGERFSATTMPRGVRAWLLHANYRDVDMANSHPTLALQVFLWDFFGISLGRGLRPDPKEMGPPAAPPAREGWTCVYPACILRVLVCLYACMLVCLYACMLVCLYACMLVFCLQGGPMGLRLLSYRSSSGWGSSADA